jgi:hypothetical protein
MMRERGDGYATLVDKLSPEKMAFHPPQNH